MSAIRGNLPVLFALFFTIAVFLTGGLYATAGSGRFGTDPLDTATMVAVVLGLLAVLVILGRIFWVASGVAHSEHSSHVDE